MDVIKTDISVFPILSFLLSIAFVYFFLKVFGKVIPNLIKQKTFKSKFNRSYGFFQLIVWIVYLLWIAPMFYSVNYEYGILITVILLVVLLTIAWFAGRDVIAGFILRSNSGFRLNAEIKTDRFQGVVVEFFSRNFKLISENGDKVLIPYSQILGKPIKFFAQNGSRISKKIQIEFDSTMSFDRIKQDIEFHILTHPKALINKYPVFNIVSQKKQHFVVDVLLYARDSQGLVDIESELSDYIINIE